MASDCVTRVMDAAVMNKIEAQGALDQVKQYRDALAAAVEYDQLADAIARESAAEDLRLEAEEMAMAQLRRERVLTIQKTGELRTRLHETLAREYQQGFFKGRIDRALAEEIYRVNDAAQGLNAKYTAPVVQHFNDNPHLIKLFNTDAEFNRQFIMEREGADVIKDPAAKDLAKIMNELQENLRLELNARGANIGKIENYGGAHKHDAGRIEKKPLEWRQSLMDNLDWERTVPWLADLEKVAPQEVGNAKSDFINTVESHILKGKPIGEGLDPVPYMERGRVMRGRRVSRALEQERVLVFKDADAWSKYNSDFGDGSAMAAFLNEMERTTDRLAQMSILGPRPEATINAVLNLEKARLQAPEAGLDKATINNLRALEKNNTATKDGPVGRAWHMVSGQDRIPENITMARVFGNIRAIQALGKLGGALFSSFSDTVSMASGLRNRFGYSWMEAWSETFSTFFSRIPPEQRKEFAGLLDVLCDGTRARVGQRFDGSGGPDSSRGFTGLLSRMSDRFFKLNGLTYWTDNLKAGAAQMVSHAIGRDASKAFADLDPGMQYNLRKFGLERDWDAIRAHMVSTDSQGRAYLYPALSNRIPDDLIDSRLGDQLLKLRKQMKDADRAARDEAVNALRNQARNDIDMAVHRMIAVEVDTFVNTPDIRDRTIITGGGQKRGSVLGEAVRTIMQFKGFPISFTRKNLYPLFKGIPGQSIGGRLGSVAMLAAQMTFFGYLSMEVKRVVKGQAPAVATMKDPGDAWKVFMAAAAQGGGMGIMGDFFLAEVNRFGGGILESAAGPTIGAAADFGNVFALTRQGEATGGDFINLAVNNTPFANLWYVRPLMDYTFLYSLREFASPGYMRRREQNMSKSGRDLLLPPSQYAARPFG